METTVQPEDTADTPPEQPPTGSSVVGIRFQKAGKPYHFLAPETLTLSPGDWVVVETMYGEQAGQVTHLPNEEPAGPNAQKLRMVIRTATGLDMARYHVMQQRAERLVEVGREEAKNAKLGIKIISAELTLDGRNAIVMCCGNTGKKSLASLRRRISSRMSCRVELRSVGPRDQAKALGGYGVCGEPLCCSRFLCEFRAVSIRMAKDQSISMAPTDITGMCGRLRCCLAYEHEVYKEEAKALPRLKSRVRTADGVGRVIDLDVLKGGVVVEIPPDGPRRDRRRFRFPADEVEVLPRDQQPQGGGNQNQGSGQRSDQGQGRSRSQNRKPRRSR